MNKLWYKKNPYLLDDDSVFPIIEENGVLGYGVLMILCDEIAKSSDRSITQSTISKLSYTYRIEQTLILSVLETSFFYKNEHGFWSSDYMDQVLEDYDKSVNKAKKAAQTRWGHTKDDAQAMLKQCTSNAQAMHKQCSSNADKIRKEKIRLDEIRLDEREGSVRGEALALDNPKAKLKTKPKAKSVKKPMPLDFEPSDHNKQKAAGLGVDLGVELDKMRNYSLANGRDYADWQAALSNWITNAANFKRPSARAGYVYTERDRDYNQGVDAHGNF